MWGEHVAVGRLVQLGPNKRAEPGVWNFPSLLAWAQFVFYHITPKIELTPATLILKFVSSEFCKASQDAQTKTSNLTENWWACAATLMPMIGTRQRFQTPGSALLFVPSCTSLPTAKCLPQFLPLVGRLVASLGRGSVKGNRPSHILDDFTSAFYIEVRIHSGEHYFIQFSADF